MGGGSGVGLGGGKGGGRGGGDAGGLAGGGGSNGGGGGDAGGGGDGLGGGGAKGGGGDGGGLLSGQLSQSQDRAVVESQERVAGLWSQDQYMPCIVFPESQELPASQDCVGEQLVSQEPLKSHDRLPLESHDPALMLG